MKKYLFATFILLPFLISCNSLDKLTKFELPFTRSITLPALPIIFENPVSASTPDIKTNIDSVLTSLNLTSDLVQTVSLKKMDLTLTDSTGGDLTFLKSISIYICATGLDDVKIAGIDSVPDNTGSSLSLAVESTDLKNFILKDEFQLKIITTTDKITKVEQKLKVDMNLQLDLKILGL